MLQVKPAENGRRHIPLEDVAGMDFFELEPAEGSAKDMSTT